MLPQIQMNGRGYEDSSNQENADDAAKMHLIWKLMAFWRDRDWILVEFWSTMIEKWLLIKTWDKDIMNWVISVYSEPWNYSPDKEFSPINYRREAYSVRIIGLSVMENSMYNIQGIMHSMKIIRWIMNSVPIKYDGGMSESGDRACCPLPSTIHVYQHLARHLLPTSSSSPSASSSATPVSSAISSTYLSASSWTPPHYIISNIYLSINILGPFHFRIIVSIICMSLSI